MPTNLSKISTLEDLQREQFIVRERLKTRQKSLQNKMYQIPGELAAAGVNSFIPQIFRGKLTNAALNGGKKLINSYFDPENATGRNLFNGSIKKIGLVSGVKSIFKFFKGK